MDTRILGYLLAQPWFETFITSLCAYHSLDACRERLYGRDGQDAIDRAFKWGTSSKGFKFWDIENSKLLAMTPEGLEHYRLRKGRFWVKVLEDNVIEVSATGYMIPFIFISYGLFGAVQSISTTVDTLKNKKVVSHTITYIPSYEDTTSTKERIVAKIVDLCKREKWGEEYLKERERREPWYPMALLRSFQAKCNIISSGNGLDSALVIDSFTWNETPEGFDVWRQRRSNL